MDRMMSTMIAGLVAALLGATGTSADPSAKEEVAAVATQHAADPHVAAGCLLGPAHADRCVTGTHENVSGFGFVGNGFYGQVAMQLRWGPDPVEQAFYYGCYGNLVGVVAVHGGCHTTGPAPPEGAILMQTCYTSAASEGTVSCMVTKDA